jgi:hypothetical protein
MTTKNHNEHNGYGFSKQTPRPLCEPWPSVVKKNLKEVDHNEHQEPL